MCKNFSSSFVANGICKKEKEKRKCNARYSVSSSLLKGGSWTFGIQSVVFSKYYNILFL
jgi:hypothetical protein